MPPDPEKKPRKLPRDMFWTHIERWLRQFGAEHPEADVEAVYLPRIKDMDWYIYDAPSDFMASADLLATFPDVYKWWQEKIVSPKFFEEIETARKAAERLESDKKIVRELLFTHMEALENGDIKRMLLEKLDIVKLLADEGVDSAKKFMGQYEREVAVAEALKPVRAAMAETETRIGELTKELAKIRKAVEKPPPAVVPPGAPVTIGFAISDVKRVVEESLRKEIGKIQPTRVIVSVPERELEFSLMPCSAHVGREILRIREEEKREPTASELAAIAESAPKVPRLGWLEDALTVLIGLNTEFFEVCPEDRAKLSPRYMPPWDESGVWVGWALATGTVSASDFRAYGIPDSYLRDGVRAYEEKFTKEERDALLLLRPRVF